MHDGINEVFCLLFQGVDLFLQVVGVSGEVICQICSTSWFILKGVVVVLYCEVVFQHSWGWLSSKRGVGWHQGFVICDNSELWQSIQVDMIFDDSRFYGCTFYFNVRVSLLLGHCRSAVIKHNPMQLRLWVQLCEDAGETRLC